MKVVIYDNNPGTGINQWFLKMTWLVGAYLQKLFGAADKVYGASSWEDAITWLINIETDSFSSIQYWGHGNVGTVFLNSKRLPKDLFIFIKDKLSPESIIWFRTCSTFCGPMGQEFSRYLADSLNCTIAGHTRIIGFLQSGLHTRKPLTNPSWPSSEGMTITNNFFTRLFINLGLVWGNNTILCFQTKIPKGW